MRTQVYGREYLAQALPGIPPFLRESGTHPYPISNAKVLLYLTQKHSSVPSPTIMARLHREVAAHQGGAVAFFWLECQISHCACQHVCNCRRPKIQLEPDKKNKGRCLNHPEVRLWGLCIQCGHSGTNSPVSHLFSDGSFMTVRWLLKSWGWCGHCAEKTSCFPSND